MLTALALLGNALVTYVAAPLGLYVVLSRFDKEGNAAGRAAIAMALGPTALSFVLSVLMLLTPGLPAVTYIAAVVGLVLLALILQGRSTLQALGDARVAWRAGGRWARGNHGAAFLWAILAGFLGLVALRTLAVPLNTNDPLEYAQTARLIYESRSLRDYPFLDGTANRGYYGPWSHPPGYIMLIVWGYLTQGSAAVPWAMKLIAPYFALVTIWLGAVAIGGRGRLGGAWAGLLLLATPFYTDLVIACHIDAMRIANLVALLFCGKRLIERQTTLNVILAGAAMGGAMFSHAAGVLALPLFAAVYLLLAPGHRWRRLWVVGMVSSLGLLPVAYWFWRNQMLFGGVIADAGAVPVYAVQELQYERHFALFRNFFTPVDAVFTGMLQGFTRTTVHGFGYYLLTVLMAIHVSRRRRDASWQALSLWERGQLSALATFYALVVGTLLLGSLGVVKNPRYMLTVLPFVVGVSGARLAALVESLRPLAAKLKQGLRDCKLDTLLAAVGLAAVVAGTGSSLALLARKWRVTRAQPPSSADQRSGQTRLPEIPGIKLQAQDPALSDWRGPFRLVAFARQHLPADAVVLTCLQSAIAFYGEHRFISHLDPRLLDVYRLTDTNVLTAALQRLGITHVSLADYPEAAIYNSALAELLADPELAELLADIHDNKLFRLRGAGEPAPALQLVHMPPLRLDGDADVGWSMRTRPAEPTHEATPLDTAGVRLASLGRLYRSQRLTQTLYSGAGDFTRPGTTLLLKGGQTYVIDATLNGSGRASLGVVGYDAGTGKREHHAWVGILDARHQRIAGQVRPASSLYASRLFLTLSGPADVTVRNITLSRIVTDHSASSGE